MSKREIIWLTLSIIVVGTLFMWLGWRLPLPRESSLQAQTIDQLWRVVVGVMAYIFALVMVLMVYALVVFRRRRGDEDGFGAPIEGNNKLEIVWTVIPVIIVIALAVYGSLGLHAIDASNTNQMIIKVTAFQWGWRFDYPKYGIKSSGLFLPLNQPVRFDMTSLDVIHSFYVPEFREKQDVLPGRITHLWITPDHLGKYEVKCAELCGLGHSTMIAPLEVVSAKAFQQWVQSKRSGPSTVIEEGMNLAQQYGCLACHSIDGSVRVGPSWKGLYDSEVKLSDGSSVKADEDYLRESIVDPSAKLVKGFSNLMPGGYGKQLNEKQILALIAYIKSLSEEER